MYNNNRSSAIDQSIALVYYKDITNSQGQIPIQEKRKLLGELASL